MSNAAEDRAQDKAESSDAHPALAASALPASDKVAFEHRFFSYPDLFFYRPEFDSEAVAVVKMGDNEVALSFRGIKSEFQIADDSPDGQMLNLVAEALGFVNGLRPGDPLPKEVLTREASWEPSEQHFQIAYSRLTLQLATWVSGKENIITNPDELLQLAEDPETKRKVTLAFEEAAEKIGLGRDRKEEVIGRIEMISKELAYIEALRDKARQISAMEQKIQALRRLYSLERSMAETIDPCARLARNAVGQFKEKFAVVDAGTAEIITVLEDLDAKIEYIRTARDDLHRRLLAWTEVLDAWNACRPEVSEENEDLLRETYLFLAPRYLQVSEWTLVTKTTVKPDGGKAKPKVRVFVRGEKPLKRIRKW